MQIYLYERPEGTRIVIKDFLTRGIIFIIFIILLCNFIYCCINIQNIFAKLRRRHRNRTMIDPKRFLSFLHQY